MQDLEDSIKRLTKAEKIAKDSLAKFSIMAEDVKTEEVVFNNEDIDVTLSYIDTSPSDNSALFAVLGLQRKWRVFIIDKNGSFKGFKAYNQNKS